MNEKIKKLFKMLQNKVCYTDTSSIVINSSYNADIISIEKYCNENNFNFTQIGIIHFQIDF